MGFCGVCGGFRGLDNFTGDSRILFASGMVPNAVCGVCRGDSSVLGQFVGFPGTILGLCIVPVGFPGVVFESQGILWHVQGRYLSFATVCGVLRDIT